ncbi:MAG: DUF4190 domain-containing protein [Mycobacterium sp.]
MTDPGADAGATPSSDTGFDTEPTAASHGAESASPDYSPPPAYGGYEAPPSYPQLGATPPSYGAPSYDQGAGYPVHPGYPVYPGYDPYQPAKPFGTNGTAIAALVISLAGLVFCGLPSVAGLVLGVIAMRETKRTGQDGYGLALTGAIIGGIAAAGLVLMILLWIGVFASGFSLV